MIAEIGAMLAVAALVLSVMQAWLGLAPAAARTSNFAAAASASAMMVFLAVVASFAVLVTLFLQSDFSVAVVYNNSHVAKPLIYKISGTWGNHEGSMLMWCMVSALFGALFARAPGAMDQDLWRRAIGVQGLVTGAALFYTLLLSNPFARLDPAPWEGRDLNPLLQDPALAAHPPMLYLGYVGMSIPFSLAIAGLIIGKVDQAWARALRPWTILAWTALTCGIALGSYWAYYELGWGGWWFWDPVENASFLPWLAAAALMHSAIVTERRGSLASWTILLAIAGFGLALLGTFLVRSGVLTSVHAFAVDPARGYAILVLFALFVGGGLALYVWRAPQLSRPTGFAAASRETALIINNFGLAVATGVILIGTLYPILAEATTGRLVSVGPPFFNAVFAPLMAILFLVTPFAPFLAWRRADLAATWRKLWLAALVSLAAIVVVVLAWRGQMIEAIGVGVGVWLILGALSYVWKRLNDGDGAPSIAKFAALPLGMWAMVMAHAGLGVLTIGAVAETGFRQERSVLMAPGETIAFAGRQITLERVGAALGPNYEAEAAIFKVEKPGGVYRIDAERRFYPAAGKPTSEVGILAGFDGDLYLALGEVVNRPESGPAWTVRLYHNPLMQWIWSGALMLAAGGALGLLALARRRKSVAEEAGAKPHAKEAAAAGVSS